MILDGTKFICNQLLSDIDYIKRVGPKAAKDETKHSSLLGSVSVKSSVSESDKTMLLHAILRTALVAAAAFALYSALSAFFAGAFLSAAAYTLLTMAIHDAILYSSDYTRRNCKIQTAGSSFMNKGGIVGNAFNAAKHLSSPLKYAFSERISMFFKSK